MACPIKPFTKGVRPQKEPLFTHSLGGSKVQIDACTSCCLVKFCCLAIWLLILPRTLTPGLADVRRHALASGTFMTWPTAEAAGLMNMTNLALNAEVIGLLVDLRAPQFGQAKTVHVDLIKEQAYDGLLAASCVSLFTIELLRSHPFLPCQVKLAREKLNMPTSISVVHCEAHALKGLFSLLIRRHDGYSKKVPRQTLPTLKKKRVGLGFLCSLSTLKKRTPHIRLLQDKKTQALFDKLSEFWDPKRPPSKVDLVETQEGEEEKEVEEDEEQSEEACEVEEAGRGLWGDRGRSRNSRSPCSTTAHSQ